MPKDKDCLACQSHLGCLIHDDQETESDNDDPFDLVLHDRFIDDPVTVLKILEAAAGEAAEMYQDDQDSPLEAACWTLVHSHLRSARVKVSKAVDAVAQVSVMQKLVSEIKNGESESGG